MLYVAPHDCACYIEAKLTGFNALAPARKGEGPGIVTPSSAHGDDAGGRLHQGPAYGVSSAGEAGKRLPPGSNLPSPIPNPADWPTYRHDPQRSGATESPVAAPLGIAWKSAVGPRPTALTVAEGRVFAAAADAHTVCALDAHTGQRLWSYTAGGRVDSPPTIYGGLAIFGSADGHVVALRAADGVLAWRFDAAPQESRVIACDQLESPWPVPGSVLVQEGKCWFAAGRSSYLDGGIHLYALDAATGKIVQQQTIYSPDPKTGKMTPEPSANLMPGLLNDIPAAVGQSVFIRQMNVSGAEQDESHLYSTGGYLDPTWFNRTFWRFGKAHTSGIMVLGKEVAYGMEVYDSGSRETVFTPAANTVVKPGSAAYRLLCLPLQEGNGRSTTKSPKAKAKLAGSPKLWQQRIPIRAIAMVRAGDVVFVAGSPDIIDRQDPHGAWEGRQGGVLAAFAAADGKPLAELKLPSPPVWDGMAAAAGHLYLSTIDGSVLCLTAK
jgi:outer membrane protein assembly factor BamB